MRSVYTIELTMNGKPLENPLEGFFFESWDDAHNYLLAQKNAKPTKSWNTFGPWKYQVVTGLPESQKATWTIKQLFPKK